MGVELTIKTERKLAEEKSWRQDWFTHAQYFQSLAVPKSINKTTTVMLEEKYQRLESADAFSRLLREAAVLRVGS